MLLKSVLQVGVSCLIVVCAATGCSSTDDEAVRARLTLLELKLDALEEQQRGETPLEMDKVEPQETAFASKESSEVVNTIPGRAAVVQPSAASAPQAKPLPASASSAAGPQSVGDDVVFLSRSAYADLTGARPVGVSAKSHAGVQTPPVKKKQDVKKRDDKKQQAPAPVAQGKKTDKRPAPVSQKKREIVDYEAALKVVLSGKTLEGREKMTAFLQRYPGSKLEPNALYWIGETWYSDKSYDKAILAFKDVTTKFPKHDKASAALFKLGACYEQLKDKGNAQFYWQALLEDFPKSEAAGLARKRLAAQ